MEPKPAELIKKLPPFDGRDINVIIDTPQGSRNKYKLDEETGMFTLGGVLTAGHSFPYDFGFIPGTMGGDGDPLDVLVLMDEPAFVGCLIKCRLIGGIEATQKEKLSNAERNDRLLATAAKSILYEEIKTYTDLSKRLLDQIEHFFVSYNEAKGKVFRPLGRFGPKRAIELVRASSAQK